MTRNVRVVIGVLIWLAVAAMAYGQENDGEVWLEWAAVEHPELTGYRVEWGTEPGVFERATDFPTTKLDAKITVLPCVKHYWRVSSLGSAGQVVPSETLHGWPSIAVEGGGRALCLPMPAPDVTRVDLPGASAP